MRPLTENQIKRIRKLGKIHALILAELKALTTPGIIPITLEERVEELFSKFKGIRSGCKGYHPRGHKTPYPTNLCVSINEGAVHVPPNDVPIKEGDLVKIDLILTDGEVYTDSAIAFIAGSPQAAPLERRRLINVSYNALYSAIKEVRPGIPLGKISNTIYNIVSRAGFDVLKDYGGHGIGTKIWQEPYIPNYGPPHLGPTLVPFIALAIEPLVCAGSPQLIQIDDWATKTADNSEFVQVEHTVLVTPEGHEILTKL